MIESVANPRAAISNLLFVANEHRFPPGASYIDYVDGKDRAAEFGVAGLVAGVLGVKLLKVAAFGGLLLILKKATWLVVFPLIYVWRKLTGKKVRTVAAEPVKQEPSTK